MIWVMNNGGKRRWVFKFIGFGEEELKSFERLDFKKLTLSFNFIGLCLLSGVWTESNFEIEKSIMKKRRKKKIIGIVGSACNLTNL